MLFMISRFIWHLSGLQSKQHEVQTNAQSKQNKKWEHTIHDKTSKQIIHRKGKYLNEMSQYIE